MKKVMMVWKKEKVSDKAILNRRKPANLATVWKEKRTKEVRNQARKSWLIAKRRKSLPKRN